MVVLAWAVVVLPGLERGMAWARQAKRGMSRTKNPVPPWEFRQKERRSPGRYTAKRITGGRQRFRFSTVTYLARERQSLLPFFPAM